MLNVQEVGSAAMEGGVAAEQAQAPAAAAASGASMVTTAHDPVYRAK